MRKAPAKPSTQEPSPDPGPSVDGVAELAVDLWRIAERAKKDAAGDRTVAACERAEDRLKRLGFEIVTMLGQAYDTNLRARVVDHEPGEGPLRIGQCISPAVYYGGKLVREAEVVTIGQEPK